jgi:hypothetical protein
MDDLMQWLIDRIGKPIPCSLCGTPTDPQRLRERWMPGAIVQVVPGCEITPQTAVWLCPRCPG